MKNLIKKNKILLKYNVQIKFKFYVIKKENLPQKII